MYIICPNACPKTTSKLQEVASQDQPVILHVEPKPRQGAGKLFSLMLTN